MHTNAMSKRSTPATLTPRMRDLCRAVGVLTERRGIPPALHEVARELRIHPSRAQKLAVDAVARGALVRDPGIPRSMRLPDSGAAMAVTTTRRKTK